MQNKKMEDLMLQLNKIDLGRDEAEQDTNLENYFLKTNNYINSRDEKKSIIIGRKGTGKSAIFLLLDKELSEIGQTVIKITPDQYSWNALTQLEEVGISRQQAATNAWKITFLSSVISKLVLIGQIDDNAKINSYNKYFHDAFSVSSDKWLIKVINGGKNLLAAIKSDHISFNLPKDIPLNLAVIDDLTNELLSSWPTSEKVRIIIDRLDDGWDGSSTSNDVLIGIFKAMSEINTIFKDKIHITVFIRQDIYQQLLFDDQDKIRQLEEYINWDTDGLKNIVCERIRSSLNLKGLTNDGIWKMLFSSKSYRSGSNALKYISDRTFKRPRDIISFIRMIIEYTTEISHPQIEPEDTRLVEEERYSESKYRDLLIEYNKQFPNLRELLDLFSGHLHNLSKDEVFEIIDEYKRNYDEKRSKIEILRELFRMCFIGIKRKGRAGVKQRGGERFYFYYDDSSVNPMRYDDFYIHPAIRHYLNITEKRKSRA